MKNEIRHQLSDKPSSTRIRADLADGRAAAQALEEPFGTLTHKRDTLVTRREAQAKERNVRTWKWVAALGAVAAFGIFGAPKLAEKIAPTATGHTYTQDELARMPQKRFTFKPNQGIDDAIIKIDGNKNIFSNGPNLAAVEDYVAAQAPGGVPQPHETVEVPKIPEQNK